mgnify:CR=1 FL=1
MKDNSSDPRHEIPGVERPPPPPAPEPTVHIRPRYYRWHVDPGIEWTETNTGYAWLDWEITLSQTALVLVDVWDKHYLADTAARTDEIIRQKIQPLLKVARQTGLQLIHAPSPRLAARYPSLRPFPNTPENRPGLDWPPPAFRRKEGEYQRFALPFEPRGSERDALAATYRIHPAVEPENNDVVIATGDELHRYCTEREILFLFYAGFNTNACILLRDYGTLEMARRGYEIALLRDCTTGMESCHTHAELGQTRSAILALEMFGKYTVTSDELVTGLKA